MAAMAKYDDAMAMVEAMVEHESIQKAIRVYKHSESYFDADEIAREYCQFVALKILSGDFSAAGAKLSPGGVVDDFWHCHVLDTVGYPKFFKDVIPPLGPLVHHDAEKSQDDQDKIKARQEKTKELYRNVFNDDCPFFSHEKQLSGKKRGAHVADSDAVVRNPFILRVKTLTGATYRGVIGPDVTILRLKRILRKKTGVPEHQQRLMLGGMQLTDTNTLANYGITRGSTVYMLLPLRGC